MVPATEFGPTYSQQKLGLFSPHKYHARTNAVSTETRIVFPHHKYHARTNAVSTMTRIVQSDVLRNSVDTTAAITNIPVLLYQASTSMFGISHVVKNEKKLWNLHIG